MALIAFPQYKTSSNPRCLPSSSSPPSLPAQPHSAPPPPRAGPIPSHTARRSRPSQRRSPLPLPAPPVRHGDGGLGLNDDLPAAISAFAEGSVRLLPPPPRAPPPPPAVPPTSTSGRTPHLHFRPRIQVEGGPGWAGSTAAVAEERDGSPRASAGGGGGGGYTDIRKEIFDRLMALGIEEVVLDPPAFRLQLDRHFERLPASYSIDLDVEKAEDVLLHRRILVECADTDKRPVFHVRYLRCIGAPVDSEDKAQDPSTR